MGKLGVRILAVLAVLITVAATPVLDRPQFALRPSTGELTLFSGEHDTVTFYVEGAPQMNPSQLDLTATLVDWRIERDGTIRYLEPGTSHNSASTWLTYSPGSVTLVAGGMERIRVTVRVPTYAEPGTYRAGILLEPKRVASRQVQLHPESVTDVFRITVKVLPERPMAN